MDQICTPNGKMLTGTRERKSLRAIGAFGLQGVRALSRHYDGHYITGEVRIDGMLRCPLCDAQLEAQPDATVSKGSSKNRGSIENIGAEKMASQ